MEFEARIAALIEGREQPLRAVAASIVELAKERGVEMIAAEVEAHLAGFKTDDLETVRYFFEDPVRTGSLMEAIGVADEEREAYRLAAAARLAPDAPRVTPVSDPGRAPEAEDPVIEELGVTGMVLREERRRRSPFVVVADLVRGLSWEQLLDDPFLDRAFAALQVDGFSTLELEYARAALLHHDKLHVFAGPRRADWRAALQAILAHEPPASGLRFRTTTGTNGHQPLLPGRRRLGRLIELDDGELLSLRAIVPFRVTRDQPRPGAFGGLRSTAERLPLLLPTVADLSRPARLIERLLELHAHRDSTPSRSDLDFTAIPIDHRAWSEADDQIGAAWLALRHAVSAGQGVTLHMGDGLLEMGAGVVARVIATRRAHPFVGDSTEADLFYETIEHFPEKLKEPSDHVLQAIETGLAVTGGVQTVLQARVPRTLYLARGEHRVVVTFRGTYWSQPLAGGAARAFDARVAHSAVSEGRPSPH